MVDGNAIKYGISNNEKSVTYRFSIWLKSPAPSSATNQLISLGGFMEFRLRAGFVTICHRADLPGFRM